MLIHKQDWDTLAAVLERLSSDDDGCGRSNLVRYLSSYSIPRGLARFCRHQDRLGFILEALGEVLAIHEQNHDLIGLIQTSLEVADLRYSCHDEDDEVIRLHEEALLSLNAADVSIQRKLTAWRRKYTNQLAQIYFDRAVRSRKGMCIF